MQIVKKDTLKQSKTPKPMKAEFTDQMADGNKYIL